MRNERTNTIIASLDSILKEHCLHRYYSLNGYAEAAVCLEKSDNGWEVFNGERNNHYGSSFFEDVKDASVELLRRLDSELVIEFEDILKKKGL